MDTKKKESVCQDTRASKGSDDILLSTNKSSFVAAIRLLHSKAHQTSVNYKQQNAEVQANDINLDEEEDTMHLKETSEKEDGKLKDVKKEKMHSLVWKPLESLNAASNKASRKEEKADIKTEIQSPADLVAAYSTKKTPRDAARERKWHDLPRTEITEDVKRDLRLLQLRGAYDPKKFYKSMDRTKFPTHFAIGTVENGATDFYSGRLTHKERGPSMTRELLADPVLARVRQRRFKKVQAAATSHLKVRRRKTDLKRAKAPHHRPKH